MDEETTLGLVFEEILEQVACARTKALMGERVAALKLFIEARETYWNFREALDGYPGNFSLRKGMDDALKALCRDQDNESETRPALTKSLRSRSPSAPAAALVRRRSTPACRPLSKRSEHPIKVAAFKGSLLTKSRAA